MCFLCYIYVCMCLCVFQFNRFSPFYHLEIPNFGSIWGLLFFISGVTVWAFEEALCVKHDMKFTRSWSVRSKKQQNRGTISYRVTPRKTLLPHLQVKIIKLPLPPTVGHLCDSATCWQILHLCISLRLYSFRENAFVSLFTLFCTWFYILTLRGTGS